MDNHAGPHTVSRQYVSECCLPLATECAQNQMAEPYFFLSRSHKTDFRSARIISQFFSELHIFRKHKHARSSNHRKTVRRCHIRVSSRRTSGEIHQIAGILFITLPVLTFKVNPQARSVTHRISTRVRGSAGIRRLVNVAWHVLMNLNPCTLAYTT
jgi:hypothetical protein